MNVVTMSTPELCEIIQTRPFRESLPAQCELAIRLTGSTDCLLLPEEDENGETDSSS